jgi:predicted DNA-binding protein (MmcQ/YjbR family)
MWRMTWDELLAYCLAKPGAWQDEPWEGDVVRLEHPGGRRRHPRR